MSTLISPTRIYWQNGLGVARKHGVQIELRKQPEITGIDSFSAIDFDPENRVFEIRRTEYDPILDMTQAEIQSCAFWLESVTCPSRDAVDREITMVVFRR